MWWHAASPRLTEDDWFLVDAWYRSRALSFAHAGEAMVPCIDMVNHASGGAINAYFDRDHDGNAILMMAPHRSLSHGDEVTISYGDAKSAAEMLFSYGFIEPQTTHTSALILDLTVPDDDPLKEAKEAVATSAAAVRISWTADRRSTQWESFFVWLICVNEEDGLRFEVVRGADDRSMLTASWQGRDLTTDTDRLETLLHSDPRWPLYELRAIVTLLERVQGQQRRLDGSEALLVTHDAGPWPGASPGRVNDAILATARHLRSLECDLLDHCRRDLEAALIERQQHVTIPSPSNAAADMP